jgi:SAM-dependent methyltransferase
MIKEKEWFGEWFNSPYYHILYKNRDHGEAQLFMDNLVRYLKFKEEDKILDLACGEGRHSIYLHKLGFDVTGIDYSPRNIEIGNRFVRRYEEERLRFFVHDMREVFAEGKFDYVLNLFTSFGYFDKVGENKKSIQAAAAALKRDGKLVIDFFNTEKVLEKLVPFEKKIIEGIEFTIEKKVESGFIIKNISFHSEGQEFKFKEKVKSIGRKDFLNYFESAGLKLIDFFGDYWLNSFNPDTSERMIYITQKA